MGASSADHKSKNPPFEVSSSLILQNNYKPFFDWIVMCDKKWILQLAMTSSVAGLRRSCKALPKPNLHQKKVLVTVRWSPASLTHYSFLNPGETIPSEKYAQLISEMHGKWRCLQPALVLREGLILSIQHSPRVAQPTLQKLNKSAHILASSAIFT